MKQMNNSFVQVDEQEVRKKRQKTEDKDEAMDEEVRDIRS